jgi:hypothetical protein
LRPFIERCDCDLQALAVTFLLALALNYGNRLGVDGGGAIVLTPDRDI